MMSDDASTPATPQTVVVVGLGYVGLPLLLAASRSGMRAVGFDVDSDIVDLLRSRVSHVDDVTDEELSAAAAEFTTDPDCLKSADVMIVCVPTPLTEQQQPDLSAVESAIALISERMPSGALVVLESTSYPGTTDGMVLDALALPGRTVGVDFHLAFSPERIDPGNPDFRLENTPKIVGGITEACSRLAADFYRLFVDDVVVVSGTREAEMAKLLENTYRHVNIALVNEMAVFSHELNIDLWEVIRAASTKPFGFQAFYPGPGVGGHCIPIDPSYLSHSVRSLGYQFRFVELAQEISKSMPSYVVSRVQDMLNDVSKSLRNARVLIVGLTYKAGVADVRETPARAVIRGFVDKGAVVEVHDPLVDEINIDGRVIMRTSNLGRSIERCDIAVVLQPHEQYLESRLFDEAASVFDTTGRLVGDTVVRL